MGKSAKRRKGKAPSALFLQRAKQLQPHVSYRIPRKRVTKADEAKVRKLHRLVFGFNDPKRPELRAPPLWKKGVVKKWKARGKGADAKLALVKAEIGQRTPKELRYVYLPREPLPDDPNTRTDPTVTFDPLSGRPIITNGYTLLLSEAIHRGAYLFNHEAEVRRAIAELERLFDVVKKHMAKRDPPRFLWRDYATFTPVCGFHPWYGGVRSGKDMAGILDKWWDNYRGRTDRKDNIENWLVAIRLDCPFSQFKSSKPLDGLRQTEEIKKRQIKMRNKRKRWRFPSKPH